MDALQWGRIAFLTHQLAYKPVKCSWLHFVVKVKPKTVTSDEIGMTVLSQRCEKGIGLLRQRTSVWTWTVQELRGLWLSGCSNLAGEGGSLWACLKLIVSGLPEMEKLGTLMLVKIHSKTRNSCNTVNVDSGFWSFKKELFLATFLFCLFVCFPQNKVTLYIWQNLILLEWIISVIVLVR